MQYSGVRAKTGFLRIRFISPSEATGGQLFSQTLLWQEVKHSYGRKSNTFMAGSQTLLWQEVKHSYGRKSNTLMAGSQTLLWQEVKHSYGRKSNTLVAIIYQQHQLACSSRGVQ
jgi:hypothetical protein